MGTLRNATTTKALCALEYDNMHFGPKRRWSILAGEETVWLGEQPIGELRIQEFAIPRKFFDQIVDAYMAEQGDAEVQTEKAVGAKAAPRSASSRARGSRKARRSSERAVRQA